MRVSFGIVDVFFSILAYSDEAADVVISIDRIAKHIATAENFEHSRTCNKLIISYI